jgi:uncharacterized protein YqgC (DUF456 family)
MPASPLVIKQPARNRAWIGVGHDRPRNRYRFPCSGFAAAVGAEVGRAVTMSRIGMRPAPNLNYPMSLVVYDSYDQAQHAVAYLSDAGFPIQNIAIVGTDLKSVERVTGRLTRGKVARAGVISGLWLGMFVGIAFALFSKDAQLGFLITTPLMGAALGLVWSQLGFAAATRSGTRDFSSVSQVVAANYEVLVEHRLAERARDLLAAMPVR